MEKDEDYAAFERVLEEAAQKHPMRILAYCVMPNHWHLGNDKVKSLLHRWGGKGDRRIY